MYINQILISCLVIVVGMSPLNASFAGQCSNLPSVKNLLEQGNYRNALQHMDKCLTEFGQPEAQDWEQFKTLIGQVLTLSSSTSFEQAYRNFQSVLKTHLLNGLEFQFRDYFDTHQQSSLFSLVREAQEKYYFYYDTGRLISHSRGIALTEQSLIWKNLTENPYRLAFDDIKSMTLIYDHGFSLNSDLSLTGWKLGIKSRGKRCAILKNRNEDFPTRWQNPLRLPLSKTVYPQSENLTVLKSTKCFDEYHEIRLSGMRNEAIIPFVSAIIYFINSNRMSVIQEPVRLNVPERERGILAGWVTQCGKEAVNPGNPIKELQFLDACFSRFGDQFKLSQTDKNQLNQLTALTFANQNMPFLEGYNNFQVVLKTHFFSGLNFKFKSNFDAPLQDALFEEVRIPSEDYYFYFDTGTLISGSRGIALTDKAIIWKNFLGSSIGWSNLTGTASRLAFDQISCVTLVHEITGWKLRLNKSEENEIVLSQLSEDNVELFVSAFIYFINLASDANLILQKSQDAQNFLEKAFEEKHPQVNSMIDCSRICN